MEPFDNKDFTLPYELSFVEIKKNSASYLGRIRILSSISRSCDRGETI